MKDRIKQIFIIVFKIALAVFLVVTLNRIFMPKYVDENLDGRITQEYYRGAKYTDVVFVGSSTVFSGINPLKLWEDNGISSYVRANASQTMWISYYMTEDAIRCHKPELVCIDTTFIKYDDDFVEEPSSRKSIDGMRLSPSKIRCAKASMGEEEKLAEYIFPLFRFHSRWKELTWDDIRYAWYHRPVTVAGFIDDSEVEPAENDELVYIAQEKQFGPKNVSYLCDTIKLCQENGIQVMLFKTPAFSDNWNDDYDRQLEEIASKYGISYINFDRYNDDIGLDYSEDTPDGGAHLNTTGADKFSAYLGDLIMRDYSVDDRRGDERYERYWDKIAGR